MTPRWQGVFPAITTQMKRDGTIDLDATARHADVLIASGVTGLIFLGSLGENQAMLGDEKRRVMTAMIEAVHGRVPVLSGVAESTTAEACRYVRDLERLGADGCMLMPAMLYRGDPRETLTHFRVTAQATGLPIMIYNNPISYANDITPELFAELADQKNFVALKESSGNTRRITDIKNLVGNRYAIFTGVDDLVLESGALGIDGWVAGTGIAFPRENQHLWELIQGGDWPKAREIYRWFTPLLHLDVHTKFVQYIKLALQETGLGAEWVRPPRLPLAGAERKQVLKLIRDAIQTRPKVSPSRRSAVLRQPQRVLLACWLAFNLGAQDSIAVQDESPLFSAPTNAPGMRVAELRQWPGQTNLALPTPASNVVAAYVLQGHKRQHLSWVFNPDATQLHLELPAVGPSASPTRIYLEHAERTAQFPDGRIVFSALDAGVHGNKAKLESHPGNHRIGFWTDAADSVSWDYKPTRWGRYDVELAYSAAGGDGTELEIEVAGQTFGVRRPSTGTWYRYGTVPVGRVYLAKAEPFQVRASCKTLHGVAAMNLKAVILRPAPEGKPIVQEPSGAVTLAAADAVTHSTMMRFEPATNKNCLGFWVNPADWADWEFAVTQPGTFEVEVWQGCGKGNGGSEVAVEVGDTRLMFTVEDTGHFQNFVPRRVGRVRLAVAPAHSLAVRPVRKKAAAVMDIRQIRLVPVGREQ